MTSFADQKNYDPANLFPIPPPEKEQTAEEQLASLEMLGGSIDRWQSQLQNSEHS